MTEDLVEPTGRNALLGDEADREILHHREPWEDVPALRHVRDAQARDGTQLTWTVRSAASATDVVQQPWRPVDVGAFVLPPGDRALQYRAMFRSDNGDRYPTLQRVEISLSER